MPEIYGPIRCPFCQQEHPPDTRVCTNTDKPKMIPNWYVEQTRAGVPTVDMLTIGHQKHGKTVYLSVLLWWFLHDPEILGLWEGFTPLALDGGTISWVFEEKVDPLTQGVLPGSSKLVADSLLFELARIPLAKKWGSIRTGYRPQSLLVHLCDIGGETYELEEVIREKLGMIRGLRNLVFLVDLTLIESSGDPVHELKSLVDTLLVAASEMGAKRRKGVVVCFTKADRLWGREEYGPLAQRGRPLPAVDEMRDYIRWMRQESRQTGEWMKRRYTVVYNTLHEYFDPVEFTAVSALGCEPIKDGEEWRVSALRPVGLMNPLFWLLQIDGLL